MDHTVKEVWCSFGIMEKLQAVESESVVDRACQKVELKPSLRPLNWCIKVRIPTAGAGVSIGRTFSTTFALVY